MNNQKKNKKKLIEIHNKEIDMELKLLLTKRMKMKKKK